MPTWIQQQQQQQLTNGNRAVSDTSPANTPPASTQPSLPGFVKPFPDRIGPEEMQYLQTKGALTIPDRELRVALLQAYVDFVYPYMPTIDLNDFLSMIDSEDGTHGKVSLLVFQAIMFAGSSFVEFSYLKRIGFERRKDARKSFYRKARLLYDFDYEDDRISLLQALLIFTHWYESPNDQKDTWHWMGIALSVATSIGLNRDPARSPHGRHRQALRRRLWWSCVIRDRLIAIGMRRPLRIKSSEHNVTMMTLEDFSLDPVSDNVTCVGPRSIVARSTEMRRKLAVLCIAKARFCDCISHVLRAQYGQASVKPGVGEMPTEFLLPRQNDDENESQKCDAELKQWFQSLPEDAQLSVEKETKPMRDTSEAPLIMNRSLLHMIYYMTLSALYRPEASPTDFSVTTWDQLARDGPTTPRDTVRYAAFRITQIAHSLLKQGLVRYLPTTGVTVLQPAIISHMMDIKSPHPDVRTQGLRGFCQSIEVLNRQRDIYAGAEYSILIIDAAVRRANIDSAAWPILRPSATVKQEDGTPQDEEQQAVEESKRKLLSIEDLVDAGLRQQIVAPSSLQAPPTPPPEGSSTLGNEEVSGGRSAANEILNDETVASRLALYLATTTPPTSSGEDTNTAPATQSGLKAEASDALLSGWTPRLGNKTLTGTPRLGTATPNWLFGRTTRGATPRPAMDFDKEFENLINTDDLTDAFATGDGGLATMQGESSGFFLDMNFLYPYVPEGDTSTMMR